MNPALFLALAALAPQSEARTPTRLLRFPDIHGERVVFCYAGDLWTAPSTGGDAARLTAHPGLELFPKFSPDGRWVAFTGQYDGDEQVYVVPAHGGEPRRLTWYPARGPLPPRWGYDHQVHGWTPDGSAVLFRSMREGWALTDTRLFTVPLEGGLPVALPMPVSGAGDYSPDGGSVVYSPLTRDFRTWKRYQGGWAQDLYTYRLSDGELRPVAHHVRTERDPMWMGPMIVFASDRDGTLNLYAFDTRSGETQALTSEQVWDVRWPSRGEAGEVVFELNGELEILEVATRSRRRLEIFVPDDGVASRPARLDVSDEIEDFDLSPKGERVLVTAHGEVFNLPREHGDTQNLTRTPGAHERGAAWSPDGRNVAFLSDRTGEEELYVIAHDGSGQARPLTRGGKVRRHAPQWSPTSRHLSFADKEGRLWIVSADSGELLEVARDRNGSLRDAVWSPHGSHLAFSLSEESGFRALWIYTLEERSLRRVTDGAFDVRNPAWDPDGEYLYYLSDRSFAPQLSTVEWNFATSRASGLFALALRKDVPHPFPPKNDEVTFDDEGDADESDADDEAKDEDAAPKRLAIDFEGLAARVTRVPVDADNYGGLSANAAALFVVRFGDSYYGRESERTSDLLAFDLDKREVKTVATKVDGYVLSHDGSKLMVSSEGDLALHDATPAGADSRKAISLAGLQVERVPDQEWPQIFDEVWRRFRDYFYVANMHGYDWQALRDRYRPLVAHVAHRSDLNYVLGEMIAELNVSHAYVAGGLWQAPERPQAALLGARFELDEPTGLYRIVRILPGHNEEPKYRSPLTEVGVDVRVGEYLLAVDGEPLRAPDNPYRLLADKGGRTLRLTIASTADAQSSREVQVHGIPSEHDLAYLDMVLSRRALVAELSGGRLGYVHVPNMGAEGLAEFIKWYYGQIRKQGLVVDMRNNGGGNVSQMLIERLSRRLLGSSFSRNSDFTSSYPDAVFTGPMVCLLNENSASDGDIFPWMFRTAGLGPLIGKRSWGGVVGISDHGPLIDGGTVNVPEFGYADAAGQWSVEGIGVEPDIVVENDPASVLAGRDPQLERGVREILDRLSSGASGLPARPADPVRTR